MSHSTTKCRQLTISGDKHLKGAEKKIEPRQMNACKAGQGDHASAREIHLRHADARRGMRGRRHYFIELERATPAEKPVPLRRPADPVRKSPDFFTKFYPAKPSRCMFVP